MAETPGRRRPSGDRESLSEWLIIVARTDPAATESFFSETAIGSAAWTADIDDHPSTFGRLGTDPNDQDDDGLETPSTGLESLNMSGLQTPGAPETLGAPPEQSDPGILALNLARMLSPIELFRQAETDASLKRAIEASDDTELKQTLAKCRRVQDGWAGLLEMRPDGTDEDYMLIDKNVITRLTRTLDCLSSDQQKLLFGAAEKIRNPWNRAEALGSFGPGLSALTELKTEVVDTVLDAIPDDGPKAAAIGGLGPGLAAVPERQDEIVQAAIGFGLEEHCADALAGIGAGAAALTKANRDLVFNKSVRLLDALSRGKAIGGFGPSLTALQPKQLATLVDAVCGMDGPSLAEAVDRLGPYLTVPPLTTAQVKRVVAAVHGMSDEVCQGKAIGGLGKGATLEPDDLKDLVRKATEREDPVTHEARGEMFLATAIGGFGPRLGALAREEQETLVTNAGGLTLEPMRAAVAGKLGRSAGSLERDLQETLVHIAIGVGDPEQKIIAFGGFGEGGNLGAMEPDLLQLLMTAAANEDDDDTRAVLIASLAA